jgi:hypothetical protein
VCQLVVALEESQAPIACALKLVWEILPLQVE